MPSAAAISDGFRFEAIDPRDDLLRALLEEFARAGEPHRPGLAIDQADAELVLEMADLPAERRLGDMHLLGRTREVHRATNCEEIAKLP